MAHLEARSGRYRYVNSEMFTGMPFTIDMAGVDRCAPNYYLKRMDSPISVIGYVQKGSGIIEQNGRMEEAREGSLFLVNCRDSHVYYPKGEWEFYWVNICGDYWREILVQYGLEEQIVFPDFRMGQEFQERIRRVTEEREELHTWQIEMQAFLLKTVLHLYKMQRFQGEDSLASGIRAEFEKYIDSHKTQEEICRNMGITARHAQRVFKQEYGVSIHSFLSEKKLQQAKALLMNTDSSIKRVALECGFENEKYFSVFFHKREGRSPTEYRMLYRSGEGMK